MQVEMRQGLVLRAVAAGLTTATNIGNLGLDVDKIILNPQAASRTPLTRLYCGIGF